MIYQVQYVNVLRLTLVPVALLASSCILLIGNIKYEVLPIGGSIIAFLLISIGTLGFFTYWNDGVKSLEIKNEGIVIGKSLILWQHIKSFKFKDDTPSFEILKIKTTEKTFTISHRIKFKDKDDFRKFYKDFKRAVGRINKEREHPIIKVPLIWDTPKGKIYAYMLIALWIVMTIGMLFTFQVKHLTYYFIFTGGALPLVMRALNQSKKTASRIRA